ncbi:MAG: metallophosphoesterase [Bacteroidia bacterium]
MPYFATVRTKATSNSVLLEIIILAALLLVSQNLSARADKMRVVWVDNPAYNARIGWNSTTSQIQTLYVGLADHGTDTSAYTWKFRPKIVHHGFKDMLTQFVRLENLLPNNRYYLVWGDQTSVTQTYFFETAPDEPTDSLSLIIGGDSRNNREARQHANIIVGRLRPDAVLFAGDMTDEDKSEEWKEWLDDWQLTRSFDRRLTPIIPARGNHERSNEVMEKLFDVPPDAYYALTIGGSLLRVYTLNSEINVAGSQAEWLAKDLHTKGRESLWRIAQYHKPIRPHVKRKREGNAQYQAWAGLFYDNGVQLAYECDSMWPRSLVPLRPDIGQAPEEGFSR